MVDLNMGMNKNKVTPPPLDVAASAKMWVNVYKSVNCVGTQQVHHTHTHKHTKQQFRLFY